MSEKESSLPEDWFEKGIEDKQAVEILLKHGGSISVSSYLIQQMLEKNSERVFAIKKIEPVFPVASGGLEPTMVPDLTKICGKDVIMQFGGGIHAHPIGTVSGAMACMQAVDVSLDGISIEEYVKTHTELKAALDKWG